MTSMADGFGGGTAAAGPYALQDTVGQPAEGVGSSADYGVEEGFWYTIHDALQAGVPPAGTLIDDPVAFSVATLLAGCVDPEGNPLKLVAVDSVSLQGGSLTYRNGWIHYSPPPGFSSTDTFSCLVQSAAGDRLAVTVAITKVNPPPMLEPIPELTANVQMAVRFANRATDPDQPLVFGLGADAPPTVFLDPHTGRLTWVPTRAQARTTNVFTVWVRDSGLPPAFATNTITVVVGDYLALGLGQTVVRAGETGRVPVTVDTSSGLTRVSVLAQVTDPQLTPLALTGWAPEVDRATLQAVDADLWRLEFVARAGQPFESVQTLGQLEFATAVEQPSAFVILHLSELGNRQTNGLPVAHVIAENGRVAVVAREPLLEALPTNGAAPLLALYGQPAATYRIDATPDVLATGGWQPVWQGTMPVDARRMIPDLSATRPAPLLLFRAQQLP
ncbi:MAG: cadherin repeat domain-containing protein [Limisphaerales bacterium]